MISGLLNTLKRDEVLYHMAYILSGGNNKHSSIEIHNPQKYFNPKAS